MYQFRNSSFTKEQLTNLGITKDMATSQQQFSRPLFPILTSKPVEIEKNNVAMDYKVLFKEDFRSRLFEIHNTAGTIKKSNDMDNYSLQIAAVLEKEHKKKLKFTLATQLMPAELNLAQLATNKRKAKSAAGQKPAKKRRVAADVVKRLDDLAEKEANNKEEDEESEKADNDSDAEAENEEVDDAELDEETDYHNNYFDNGENFFADEDDALDDGPVY